VSVRILDSAADLAAAAAEEVATGLESALAARSRAALVLAGGSTPRRLYRLLGGPSLRQRIDWRRIELFWGDERCGAGGHSEGNYRMARETLLEDIDPAPEQIHHIDGSLPPEEAARRYEQVIRRRIGGEQPCFDLVLLGLGADGHTASLFPDRPELEGDQRLAVATRSPRPPHQRVSLTPLAFNGARRVVFLVDGEEKAVAVERVLERRDPRLPASWIGPRRGELLWLLDRAAAGGLERALPDRKS